MKLRQIPNNPDTDSIHDSGYAYFLGLGPIGWCLWLVDIRIKLNNTDQYWRFCLLL